MNKRRRFKAKRRGPIPRGKKKDLVAYDIETVLGSGWPSPLPPGEYKCYPVFYPNINRLVLMP